MNEARKGQILTRREALPLIVVGLGGLTTLAGGCSSRPVNFDPEPVRGQLPKSTEKQQVNQYDALGFKAEEKSFNGLRMYKNPLGPKERLSRNLVMVGDPFVVSQGGPEADYAPQDVSVQLFVLTDREVEEGDVQPTVTPRRQVSQTSLSVSLANSRLNPNIGEVKVSDPKVLRAEQLVHPDELNELDKSMKAYKFTLGLSKSGGADNVLRVLSNDFNLSVNSRDFSTKFAKAEVYSVKQQQDYILERNPNRKPEWEWYHSLGYGTLAVGAGVFLVLFYTIGISIVMEGPPGSRYRRY